MKLKSLIHIALSLPKTIIFNFRSLPFAQAAKLPIFIDYKTKVGIVAKGVIRFSCPLSIFMISFGRGGSNGIISLKHSELWLESGCVSFSGKASFAEGCSIRNSGNLQFGKNFSCGKNTFIACTQEMTFGESVLIGWNCAFRDSNGHTVIVDGVEQNNCKTVHIGNHVWIGAESHILKGTAIGDNSIVGYGSVVSSCFADSHVLIVGHPAQIKKTKVDWVG